MKLAIVISALIVSLWFVFDCCFALVTGDYVTPTSGPYKGQLGPWSKLIWGIGIDPRSSLMMWIFVIWGLVWSTVSVSFLLELGWSWWAMLIFAVISSWYLPFGTILCIIQIVLLLMIDR